MKNKEYLTYDQSELHKNGTCNFFHRLGGPLHVHRQVEMMYCAHGTLTARLGERQVTLKEGDFVLVKPFELHAYTADAKVTNRFIAPIFPDTVSDRLTMCLSDSMVCSDSRGIVKEILLLYKHFNALSAEPRSLYFHLLEELADTALAQLQQKPTESIGANILQYIAENFTENLTLESVAAACCTNRSTVSRTVNRQCTCNFNTYLNRIRIHHFLRICLRRKSENIEKIAQSVGFQSPRTFYRTFYSEFHTTPGQYLNTLQNENTASRTPTQK